MTRAVPVLALALLLPASAHAQAADAPTPSLPVNPGEKIIVTRMAGDGTLRGRLVGIVDGSVVLDDGPTRHVVPMDDVDRVERPKDRIWNGALIGYGIGFAAGAVMVLSDSCRPQPGDFINLCFDGPEFAMAVGAVITGPIGMAAGAIGDAIRRKPRVVFDRASRGGVALVVYPAFVRGGAGLRMAMTF